MARTRKTQQPDSSLYHDTWMLLQKYRDVRWSVALSVQQLKSDFKTEYGQNIDDFLDSLDAVGVDLSGTELEEHARSIQRSNRMLAILEGSLELLRRKPNDGEECYWVLYYTYICPQASSKAQEVVFKLSQHKIDVSVPTYYRRRQAAIDALSAILWGYTARDTNEILNHYLRHE